MTVLTKKMSFQLEMHEEEIPTKLIYSDIDFNCRKQFSEDSVHELRASISEQGLLNAIQIQPYDKIEGFKYRIVAGHRRFMACQMLDYETIRCNVLEGLTEARALMINLQENVARTDLTFMEEARAVVKLSEVGFSDTEIQQQMGKSYGWCEVRRQATKLPTEVQAMIEANLLTQNQIKDLYSLRHSEEAQKGLIKMVMEARRVGDNATINLKKLAEQRANAKKQKSIRTMSEIGKMQDVIREGFHGNNITTRALGWCMGVVGTDELYNDLREELGPSWNPPEPDVLDKMIAERLKNNVDPDLS